MMCLVCSAISFGDCLDKDEQAFLEPWGQVSLPQEPDYA